MSAQPQRTTRRRRRVSSIAALGVALLAGVGLTFAPAVTTRDRPAFAARTVETSRAATDVPTPGGSASVAAVGLSSTVTTPPRLPDRIVSGTASTTAQSPVPEASVNVRSYGATGDGRTDDTKAIQRANDALARRGGGRLYFPPGVYMAGGVKQDSFVEFVGGSRAILRHPDGRLAVPIVSGRVREVSGSIARGSNVLTVSDAGGIVPGAVVGVHGAGGASNVQVTQLRATVNSSSRRLLVKDVRGFHSGSGNHLVVGGEIVSYGYTDVSGFQNVSRGLFGTAATGHAQGVAVHEARSLVASVVSVSGNRVVLDHPADLGVRNVRVYAGSVKMAVRGLTLDGHRVVGGSPSTNPIPLVYELGRWVTISRTTIRNGDHGGIMFDRGTRDSTISSNHLSDNGTPNSKLGASIWLFRGASHNSIRDNILDGDSYSGVILDDRTAVATGWDAPANDNRIEDNRIEIPRVDWNSAIQISASSNNIVRRNTLGRAFYGIAVTSGQQGTRPRMSESNAVSVNDLFDNYTGLFVTGSRNSFTRNTITGTTHNVVDRGSSNEFDSNGP